MTVTDNISILIMYDLCPKQPISFCYSIRYDGWLDAIKKTWASEGASGLFKGSVPRIIWYIPASAFTFMAVEFLRENFNEKMDTDAEMPLK